MQRVNAQLTQVVSNRSVNILNVGYYRQTSDETSFIGDNTVGKIQFNSGLSVLGCTFCCSARSAS